jgi:hypothetical protein
MKPNTEGTAVAWRPSASIGALRLLACLNALLRDFFLISDTRRS